MTSLALALVLTIVPLGTPAAQSPVAMDGPVVIAQGEATIHQPADVAWMQIAVEARGGKPEDARQQAAATMTSVMTTLRRLVPADAIKTSIFSVQPEMEYSNNAPRVKDYLARNQIEIRIDDLDKLAAVMDASVSSGATSVAGLRFDVKKREEIERDALGLAVRDATQRAQAMATGAGRSLGPPMRIQEQRVSGGPMMQRMTMDAVGASRAGVATPITPGDIEVRADVMLTIAIK
jgi:uncharacterized protein YggE